MLANYQPYYYKRVVKFCIGLELALLTMKRVLENRKIFLVQVAYRLRHQEHQATLKKQAHP